MCLTWCCVVCQMLLEDHSGGKLLDFIVFLSLMIVATAM